MLNIFFYFCSLLPFRQTGNMMFNSQVAPKNQTINSFHSKKIQSIIKVCETGYMSLQKFKISPPKVILTIQAHRKISKVALPFKDLTLYISTKQNG